MSCKIELVEKKDPIEQLVASISSIKDLFNDLLDETNGFKYQITLKVMFKKYNSHEEIEFRPVYFNSTAKIVINHKSSLENAFQEILYRIDNWINEGSGWIVELIESQYINISTYRPLSGSSYVKLPAESRSPKKRLINIKNNDEKCFLWCHARHIYPVKIHPERITQNDEKLVNGLDYDGLSFLCKGKILARLKLKTIFELMCFVMKTSWFFQSTFQMKNLKNRWICCL